MSSDLKYLSMMGLGVLFAQIFSDIYWSFYMAVTLIDSRVKFRKDQRPNKSDFLYGVDDVKEDFFLVKEVQCRLLACSLWAPCSSKLCSVMMVELGVRRLHFPAFLVRGLPVAFCQVEAQAGNQKVEGTWENYSSSFLLSSASDILARKVGGWLYPLQNPGASCSSPSCVVLPVFPFPTFRWHPSSEGPGALKIHPHPPFYQL